MRKTWMKLGGVVAAALMLMAPAAAAEDADALRVLLVTGGGWHDFETQQDILRDGIGERINAEFTVHWEDEVGTERMEPFEDPNWPEQYDLVVYNISFGAVESDDEGWVRENIVERHVEHGLPAVVIHGTIHTYRGHPDADTWQAFLGLRSMNHQSHQPFTVEALEPDHPIIADMPLPWETPNGELYNVEEVYDTAAPLTHSLGEDEDYHVNIWTNVYEGVRVFGTTIGHHNETMEHEVYQDMLAQGIRWAIGALEE